MGRHSGAICRACQQRILVRDGRLIEHSHDFPALGKSLTCVGSYSKATDDWTRQESVSSPVNPGALAAPPAAAGRASQVS